MPIIVIGLNGIKSELVIKRMMRWAEGIAGGDDFLIELSSMRNIGKEIEKKKDLTDELIAKIIEAAKEYTDK